jgi:small subunit ribosomal protein S21
MAFENSLKGSTVYVKNDNVEQAMRKFKKKIQDSGLLLDMRARECYEKPTTERKRKAAAAKNRWKKKLASQRLPEKLY